ncbi:hypothetical protein HPB51_018801 [Rhipicephalus microplus]|uniref:Uncharacterized protein n=1 Tax=Rhipicephalus microplus TaxID=6941 RepID=A0A9J6DJB1_RHIMP|nr:hypothetical protein HPB51_018801 [Rhipicephalus microplus]
MGADRTLLLLFFLAATATFASCADDKTTKGPLDCPEPVCASKDCKTKVGTDGCLVCDCKGDCPLLVCGPGCHEEKNATAKCPECVCDGDPRSGLPPKPPCGELTCPPECEKETVTPTHRCPWCLCPVITDKRINCVMPPSASRMLSWYADPLARHVLHFQEQVRHQDGVVQHLLATSGKPADSNVPKPPECVTPKCEGKGCKLVPGDHGCPSCVCTEAGQKKKGGKAKASKVRAISKRNSTTRKESSEESHESNSRESHENRTSRSRREHTRLDHNGHKNGLRHANHTAPNVNGTELRQVHPVHTAVQCVVPVCEPYCKYRQGEHGCLVCECPDVCPDMVCGVGCQPYFTDASKCQKCLCAPHARREQLAEVFASFCSEHTLHRMVADFDDFRDTLQRLQHRSLELQELLNRVEHARGIHGPVPEEVRASFGRHHHNHHQPLHHQADHHYKYHPKLDERHHN